MREIVVISGKGGTGKTSVTAAFAHLAAREPGGAMLCDLDVDAPDLHLLLGPDLAETHEFRSGHEAVIDPAACTNCGLCAGMCRFGAVRSGPRAHSVDALRCEGCMVCVRFCPAGAIEFRERLCGRWHASGTRLGPMIHAQLFPGQENSGRLVALLKKEARERAQALDIPLMLCDGAPGIGCPVISSLSGASLAAIVTEPTPSGLHDLLRVAELCAHFRIPAAVLVNKFDLNPGRSEEIEAVCRERGVALLGRLPHDETVVRAMAHGRCVTELPESPVSLALTQAWAKLSEMSRGASPRSTPFINLQHA
jgi:MinD superfamily P-loop ATPase